MLDCIYLRELRVFLRLREARVALRLRDARVALREAPPRCLRLSRDLRSLRVRALRLRVLRETDIYILFCEKINAWVQS